VTLPHRGVFKTDLQFMAPEEPGEYEFDVYLVSDSYIGLDQQHRVRVQVVGDPVSAEEPPI